MSRYIGHRSEYDLSGINFLNDSAYRNVRRGLVLYLDAANKASYPGSGTTWYDLSDSGTDGTLTNSPAYSSDKRGYFTFNGSNTGVAIPGTNLSLNTMTISSWFYAPFYAQDGFLFEKTTNGNVNTQYSLFFNNANNIYFRTQGLSTVDLVVNTYSSGILNNTWNNIVATYDGTNKRIYINGVLVATSANLTGSIVQNNTGLAYVGIYGNFAGYPFRGNISSIQVYNRALSDEEISQNFDSVRDRYGL